MESHMPNNFSARNCQLISQFILYDVNDGKSAFDRCVRVWHNNPTAKNSPSAAMFLAISLQNSSVLSTYFWNNISMKIY